MKHTEVFIAGAGGLGSSISVYLVVAGVGKMRVVDHDVVELSNLNRQILHWEEDVERRKVESAEEKIRKINSDVEVEVTSAEITEEDVLELVGDSDLIIDAMDNFPTRYLLNRTAIAKGIPLLHGAVSGFYGQVTTIIPGKTACLSVYFQNLLHRQLF